MLTFFGLTPQYRNNLFTQIHDLVFHGGGGFQHLEVYNMPIWLRKFHIQKINEHNKKQREELEKAQQAAEDFKLHQGTDRYDFSQFSQAFGGSVNPFKVLKR